MYIADLVVSDLHSKLAVAMKKAHVLSGGSPTGPDGHDFSFPVVVTAEDIPKILGPRKFHSDNALEEALPGKQICELSSKMKRAMAYF